jgi:hypothetical protein
VHLGIKNAHKVLIGISERRRSLGRLGHSWECNIKNHLKK